MTTKRQDGSSNQVIKPGGSCKIYEAVAPKRREASQVVISKVSVITASKRLSAVAVAAVVPAPAAALRRVLRRMLPRVLPRVLPLVGLQHMGPHGAWVPNGTPMYMYIDIYIYIY